MSPKKVDRKRLSSLRDARGRARAALVRAAGEEFKPESSAKWTDAYRSWNGIVHVKIEHDTVKGCTPAMMRWWFENLSGTTTWDGEAFDGPEVSKYHLWHHRDHISVTPLTNGPSGKTNDGFLPGALSRIDEVFSDHHERVSAVVSTERLDDEEFTFTVRKYGFAVGKIIHLYSSEPGGLRFYAESQIGVRLPVLGWVLNWFVLPRIYSLRTADRWIRHNIEETGRSEVILPKLYRRHALGEVG
jgi:hypothetical protein